MWCCGSVGSHHSRPPRYKRERQFTKHTQRTTRSSGTQLLSSPYSASQTRTLCQGVHSQQKALHTFADHQLVAFDTSPHPRVRLKPLIIHASACLEQGGLGDQDCGAVFARMTYALACMRLWDVMGVNIALFPWHANTSQD